LKTGFRLSVHEESHLNVVEYIARIIPTSPSAVPLDIFGCDAYTFLTGSGTSQWLSRNVPRSNAADALASLRNAEAKYLAPLEDTETRILKRKKAVS